MMSVKILVLLIWCIPFTTFSQEYFEKVIDYQEEFNAWGSSILPVDDGGYILAIKRNQCDNGNCCAILKLDRYANIIWSTEHENMFHNFQSLYQDGNNIILGTFDKFQQETHYILIHDELGNLIRQDTIDSPKVTQKTFGGAIGLGDYNITAGQVRRPQDPEEFYVATFWVNKNTGTLDTVILEENLRSAAIWKLDIDKDSLLTVMYSYDTFNPTYHYRRIAKFDADKNMVWEWDSGPLHNNSSGNRSAMTTLSSGDITLSNIHTKESSRSAALWSLNELGEKKWQIDLEDFGVGNEYIVNLSEATNGDILGCGGREDRTHRDVRTGIVFRASPDGQLLWKHAYADTLGFEQIRGGELLDIKELSDGSLVATGYTNTRYINEDGEEDTDRDIWLLHMNEHGCLQDQCGTDLLTSIYDDPVLSHDFHFYPNPVRHTLISDRNLSGTIKVFDMQGAQVHEVYMNDNALNIDMSTYAPGIYILHFIDDLSGATKVDKVIKL